MSDHAGSVPRRSGTRPSRAPAAGPVAGGAAQTPVLIPDAASPLQVLRNPFQHGTSVRLDLCSAAQASVRVYNPDGHVMRTVLSETSLHAGSHTFWWNGRDRGGQPVPAGEYLVRAIVGGTECSEKIVRTR